MSSIVPPPLCSSVVRTRFAPSPTGSLHIGSVRTALYAFLFARKHRGQFLLRIEDTDLERSEKIHVQGILEAMDWLQLEYDGPVVYQSERFERYQAVVEALLAAGQAYYCVCSKERLQTLREEQLARREKPRYDGRCRARLSGRPAGECVVRIKTSATQPITVKDVVHGAVAFPPEAWDDWILLRSDGSPTYNLTVVVDDVEMAITHVIRGDDHLNNTPKQMGLYSALGKPCPIFAHIPMILGPEGQKLSKREGAANILEWRKRGYLPEAVLNYLLRLGWSHGDQEIFSRWEMIALFDLEHLHATAAAINPEKLLWLNQHYLKSWSTEQLTARLLEQLSENEQTKDVVHDSKRVESIVELYRDRFRTLEDLLPETAYFFMKPKTPTSEDEALMKAWPEALFGVVEAWLSSVLWEEQAIQTSLKGLLQQHDLKMPQLAVPLRVMISGQSQSPALYKVLALLGRETVLQRVREARMHLHSALPSPSNGGL